MQGHGRIGIDGRHGAMRRVSRAAVLVVAGSVVTATLGGCIYSSKEKERVVAQPPSTVVVAPPAERVVTPPAERVVVAPTTPVVTSPEGRWQLYGDGTSASPYYWAWIPAGASPPAPPPAPRL